MTVIQDRLAWFDELVLKSGSHTDVKAGACALEAAAYLAGEKWSDHPECVCPTIAAFGRAWNDALDDDTRNRLLKPLVPSMVGTRSTPDVQDARAFMAADWAVRVFTPSWLRKAGLREDADALIALPALTTVELCSAAMPVIVKARKSAAAAGDAAWAAAWAAAGAAAWAAAGAAAWAAAWAAAGDAAWAAAWAAAGAAAWAAAWAAAGAAAWAAAGAAAWAAAWAAAGDAAGAALQDTVTELQASAADLLQRMIAVTA